MSDHSNEGFLRRWSSRKSDARQGKILSPGLMQVPPVAAQPAAAQEQSAPAAQSSSSAAPAPTLDDVGQLTPASDFSAFVQREVPVDVKNAAMRKLFADPHFNVMDGLDVYIDDYSRPDPLVPAMLRQMASAQFLKLVDEPKESMLDHHHDHADLRLQPDTDPGPPDAGKDPA